MCCVCSYPRAKHVERVFMCLILAALVFAVPAYGSDRQNTGAPNHGAQVPSPPKQ